MNIEDLALKVEVAKVKHASHYTVNASIEQLQSIADRLSIPSISTFASKMTITPQDKYHMLIGDFKASVILTCSRTAEEFEFYVEDFFECILSQQELEDDEQDVEVYEEEVDIAEIAIQYLSLSLPDYPIHPKIQDGINANDLVYSDEGEIVKDDPHKKFKDTLAELKGKQ